MSNEWWRGACIYHIYPRSFNDTTNSGIGDLAGIYEKLEYIASLGVDGVWISPFYPSPMKDFGYDVADYRDVDPLFGTLDDFKKILSKAHDLGLKIIIDLVLSHTSDEHPWFIQSRQSKDTPKADWYVWADAKEDGSPPNNWASQFGGSAWEWDETREQYYMHNFVKGQPDLNYHNPDVQNAAMDVARYWLEMGVDGLRLDVVNYYFHDDQLRDNPPNDGTDFSTQFEGEDLYSQQKHIYDKSRPENLEFIKKLRKLTDEYTERFTIGEITHGNPYSCNAEYTAGNDRLNTAYNLHLMRGLHLPLTEDVIRIPFEEFAKEPGESWPSWAFSNHDVVRAASRWHDKGDGYTHDPAFSKLLIALLGCIRGTIYLYQGEELGLPEAKIAFEDLVDPWGIEHYPQWQGRDGARTLIPWTDHAPQKSWLPTPQNHLDLNAADQEKDAQSTLNFTRRFLNWRKNQPALLRGDITFIPTDHAKLLIFKRTLKDQTIECIFNLGGDTLNFKDDVFEPYSFSIAGFQSA